MSNLWKSSIFSSHFPLISNFKAFLPKFPTFNNALFYLHLYKLINQHQIYKLLPHLDFNLIFHHLISSKLNFPLSLFLLPKQLTLKIVSENFRTFHNLSPRKWVKFLKNSVICQNRPFSIRMRRKSENSFARDKLDESLKHAKLIIELFPFTNLQLLGGFLA